MPITNRQVISDVTDELKRNNIDQRVSRRFILSRLRDRVKKYIKQDIDPRRLFKITEIWRTVKSLEMSATNLAEIEFNIPNCSCIMKSKKRLPDAFTSNYGTLINVFTINGGKQYNQTKLTDYIDIKGREYANKNIKYFWLEDGYLYIPDSEVEAVRVSGLFQKPEEVDKLNEEKGSECASPLDSFFVCPEHLIDLVKTETTVQLIKELSGVVEDQRPDGNENSK